MIFYLIKYPTWPLFSDLLKLISLLYSVRCSRYSFLHFIFKWLFWHTFHAKQPFSLTNWKSQISCVFPVYDFQINQNQAVWTSISTRNNHKWMSQLEKGWSICVEMSATNCSRVEQNIQKIPQGHAGRSPASFLIPLGISPGFDL